MHLLRILEYVFVVYFASHIPITLTMDLAIVARHIYPKALLDITDWYTDTFKDPLVADAPVWFKSFIFCEFFMQLPFFFVATYAFWKGSCRWIRIPAIIYSTHLATMLISILSHILFNDFSNEKTAAPQTLKERLTLSAVYAPYLLIPLLILATMLCSEAYAGSERKTLKRKTK